MNKKTIIIGIILIALILIFIFYNNYVNDYSLDEETEKYLNNITYDIPNNFEKENYTYRINYRYHKNLKTCEFNLNYFDNYNNYENGEEYLKDNISFTLNDIISEVKESDINNYKWYMLEKESKSYKNYYYATIYNGIGYYMEYEIYDYNNGDHEGNDNYCDVSYDKIISSVKFK